MKNYSFPKDLYVHIDEIEGQGIRALIYRRIEKKEAELNHMKCVGLVWLGSKNLENLSKRLEDETSWDTRF